MEIKEKITVGVLLLILSSLTFLGGATLNDSEIFYCADRELVMQCDRLSSTTKTCYNAEVGNKICYEGWAEVIKDLPDTEDIIIPLGTTNAKQYLCDTKECVVKQYV